jgi:hypothetical protein
VFEGCFFWEKEVIGCEFGVATLKTFGPTIELNILNYEAGLNGSVLIVGDDFSLIELRVLTDKLLLMNILRL